MALIRKKGSEIFYVDFRDQDGRRHRISTGTSNRRVARQIETKTKADVASGKFLGVLRGQLTLRTTLERYINWLDRTGRRTERATHASKHLLRLLPADARATSLDVRSLDAYQCKRLTVARPATVRKELSVLRAALNRGVRVGELQYNPIAGKLPRIKTTPRTRVLSDTEIDALFDAAKNRRRYVLAALALMVGAGLRRGEALGLLWQDVDLEAGSIVVKASKTQTVRTVPLADWVRHALETMPKNGKTVVAKRSGKPLHCIRGSFKEVCKEAGIQGVTLHDLRRSYATRLAQSGCSPWIIKEVLGHSQLRTSELYVHISDKAIKDAISAACPAPPTLDLGSDATQEKEAVRQSCGHK